MDKRGQIYIDIRNINFIQQEKPKGSNNSKIF